MVDTYRNLRSYVLTYVDSRILSCNTTRRVLYYIIYYYSSIFSELRYCTVQYHKKINGFKRQCCTYVRRLHLTVAPYLVHYSYTTIDLRSIILIMYVRTYVRKVPNTIPYKSLT